MSHLFYVDVLFGAGLKHSDPHRLPKMHRVLGLHPFPGRIVILVSD